MFHFVGKETFWRSSAHVLAEVAELHYECLLAGGRVSEDGFYFDMAMDHRAVSQADFTELESLTHANDLGIFLGFW